MVACEAAHLRAGFGHFALAVPDVYKAVDDIKAAGEESGLMSHFNTRNM
jgi:hypothetical protein